MEIYTPLTNEKIKELKSGDKVELSGTIYTARDAAHARIVDALENDNELPFPLEGEVIYYVGPAPASPGRVLGPAGPTTSYRMDGFAPILLEAGLKGMIGKGPRNEEVKKAIKLNQGIYFAAVGGAAALISERIKDAEIIAYADLGPEAVRKLEIKKLPLIVINDIHGNDLYEQGVQNYKNI